MPTWIIIVDVIVVMIAILLIAYMAYTTGVVHGKKFVYKERLKSSEEQLKRVNELEEEFSKLMAIKHAYEMLTKKIVPHEINDADMDRENFDSDEEFNKNQI